MGRTRTVASFAAGLWGALSLALWGYGRVLVATGRPLGKGGGEGWEFVLALAVALLAAVPFAFALVAASAGGFDHERSGLARSAAVLGALIALAVFGFALALKAIGLALGPLPMLALLLLASAAAGALLGNAARLR